MLSLIFIKIGFALLANYEPSARSLLQPILTRLAAPFARTAFRVQDGRFIHAEVALGADPPWDNAPVFMQ